MNKLKIKIILLVLFSGNIASASNPVQLFYDNHFENGFIVLKPVHKKRIKGGVISPSMKKNRPVWELAQWGSRFDLSNVNADNTSSSAIQFHDGAKRVIFENFKQKNPSLIFEVDARKEYQGKLRKLGEHWPHLLTQQHLKHHPKVTDLDKLWFQIEFQLLKSKAFKQTGWTKNLHTAQFLAFLTVQNRNKESAGFGDFLWFGIPMYDARYRFPRTHKALDKGTGKFIYTLGDKQFTDQSAHDGNWVTIRQDLLPLIRNGLNSAWENGFVKGSRKISDYEIRAFNIGWEITGTYHVAMKFRNLSLEATLKDQ